MFDTNVKELLSVNFLIFSLGVFCVTFILRRVLEYFVPSIKVAKWWTELVLLISPIIVGCLMGIALSMFPFPTAFKSVSGRGLLGAVAGLFSSKLYRIIKSMLKKNLTTEEQVKEDSDGQS